MTNHFDEEVLGEQLRQLSAKQRTAFSAACAEHLWPILVDCLSSAGLISGVGQEFRSALDRTWRFAQGDDHETDGGDRLRDLVSRTFVALEDSPVEAEFAESAGAAIAYAEESSRTDGWLPAVWAARRVLECADLEAQLSETNETAFDPAKDPVLPDAAVIEAALDIIRESARRATEENSPLLKDWARKGAIRYRAHFDHLSSAPQA